jgi:hypothetical protein
VARLACSPSNALSLRLAKHDDLQSEPLRRLAESRKAQSK